MRPLSFAHVARAVCVLIIASSLGAPVEQRLPICSGRSRWGPHPVALSLSININFDAPSRRVYLSHGTEVKVLDADSDKLIGDVTGLKRDHGVAIVADLGRALSPMGMRGRSPSI